MQESLDEIWLIIERQLASRQAPLGGGWILDELDTGTSPTLVNR